MFPAMSKTYPDALLKKITGERRWHEPAIYLTAIVICLWILGMMLKLHRADLGTPFLYEGDGLFYSMVIKAIIKNGWYLTNDALGAPHGQEMYDFPQPDNFNYLLIKLMGLFTSNYATIFNLFYLMTFPLTTICSFYVLRKFNVSRGPALLASLLYTFTFYHLSRGQHHLMYTAYYPVPLMVMVMLWVCGEKISLTRIEDGRTRFNLRSPKLIASLLICVLVASTGGAYYSFFAMLLLASVALFLAIRHKSFAKMITPAFLIAVILGVALANLAPNIVHRMKYGKTDAAQRNAGEAELYGLKIAQLLLPANEHRLKSLSRIKNKYNQAPLSTENVDSSLGFIGSFGFLFLLAWLIYRRGRRDETSQPREVLEHLSILNVSAVLIGTIGGFGSLFALLISPQIRAYNRISVYIAFFSFFTVALALDRLSRGFFQSSSRQKIFYVLIVLLIAIGVLDQTKKRYQRDYKEVKTEFLSDREFMRQIESVMPERAMIFQLPVYMFPEGDTYDHLKGYLQSDKLRWSYGGMRGRAGDLWQKSIAAMPLSALVETVASAGFNGIYIDRGHYPDAGKAEAEIAAQIGSGPIVSPNYRLTFFDLTEYRKGLNADPEKALQPLLLNWQNDFSIQEGTPDNNWRWCAASGKLVIENYLTRDREVTIEFAAASVSEGNLRIESPNFSEKIRTGPTPTQFSKKFMIAPGSYSIRFISDIPAVAHPPDTRLFSFRINNFKLTEDKK
jgi:phosphoglycerol transferase